MRSDKKLLLSNRAWAKEKLDLRPDYFQRMEYAQKPEFLWIGCSDSRVPAEEITGAEPGELFVHRNIANLVVHTDFNLMSVLQYAVEVLKVPHIIVCGHYGCGGVLASLSNDDLGLINKWLRHIKDIFRFHSQELNNISELHKRWAKLVELNVIEQTHNIAETSMVQRAWRDESRPCIHGWVYDLQNGLIKELACIEPGTKLDEIYTYREKRNSQQELIDNDSLLVTKLPYLRKERQNQR